MDRPTDAFEQLLRLLREEPEKRQAVLQALFPEAGVLQGLLALAGLPTEMRGLTREVRALGERVDRLEAAVTRLAEAQARTEARVGRLEDAVVRLAEAQARTEETVARLAERMTQAEERLARLEEAVTHLAERMAQAEERLSRLEAAVVHLTERMAQAEERLARLEETVARLADAQARTEAEVARLVEAQAEMARRLGALEQAFQLHRRSMEDFVRRTGPLVEANLGRVLERILRARGWRLRTAPAPLDLGDFEVDLVAQAATAAGQTVWVLGEVRGRVRAADIQEVARKFRAPETWQRLAQVGITRPALIYLGGLAVSLGTEATAERAGLGLFDPRGERVPAAAWPPEPGEPMG